MFFAISPQSFCETFSIAGINPSKLGDLLFIHTTVQFAGCTRSKTAGLMTCKTGLENSRPLTLSSVVPDIPGRQCGQNHHTAGQNPNWQAVRLPADDVQIPCAARLHSFRLCRCSWICSGEGRGAFGRGFRRGLGGSGFGRAAAGGFGRSAAAAFLRGGGFLRSLFSGALFFRRGGCRGFGAFLRLRRAR